MKRKTTPFIYIKSIVILKIPMDPISRVDFLRYGLEYLQFSHVMMKKIVLIN